MAFNVRNQADPTSATDNWSKSVQASGAKLAKGYANPRRDPKAAAKAASGRWLDAVTNAKPALEAGIDRYNADAAIATMQSVGASRYTQAGTAKKDNYGSVAAKLLPAIQQVAQSLPADRSTPGARDARMLANVQGMRGLRGKFRKGSA